MSGGGGLGTDSLPLAIGVVSFCIVMVGAFASSEASILAANRIRIQQLADRGDKRAKAFCELRDEEDKMFATILAVENMFIILAASFGVSSAENILGPDHKVWLGFASIATLGFIPFLLEFLIVLFGEITPKTYAARHATRMALMVSRPLNFIIKLLYPIIRFTFVEPSRLLIKMLDRIFGSKENTPSITEEELRMIIDRSSQEGVLDVEERDLLHNVFEFGDTVVSEVMTNRTQILAFESDELISEALPEMLESGFSRFPVYEETIDEIRGIVHLKDLFKAHHQGQLKPEDTLAQFIQPTLFVPEDKHVTDLLAMMQTHQIRTVIVADEYGGTEGIITLRDLMNEIFGNLEKDHSDQNEIREHREGVYRVQGQTSIYDLDEELDIKLPEGKYQSIAGFVLDQLGHIPVAGESCTYDKWDFIVTEVIGPKILEVEIQERKPATAQLELAEDLKEQASN